MGATVRADQCFARDGRLRALQLRRRFRAKRAIKKTATGFEGTDAPIHKIRITLTSRKVKELEKVCEVSAHNNAEQSGGA
ncbi:MAG: hypothetical protein WKF53_10295, partial [Rubrobacter sp.]